MNLPATPALRLTRLDLAILDAATPVQPWGEIDGNHYSTLDQIVQAIPSSVRTSTREVRGILEGYEHHGVLEHAAGLGWRVPDVARLDRVLEAGAIVP